MKKIQLILPHIVFISAIFFIVLWILDQLNPLMGFLNNPLSDMLLLLFFLTAALNGICDIHTTCHTKADTVTSQISEESEP